MDVAQKNRSQAATNLNLHSSRSHCIFQLVVKIVKKKPETGEKTEIIGTLNMVDLAGSENSKISGVEGDRLEECKSINKSLSALTKVFKAIKDQSSHIPYRDSKLTQILEKFLNKDTKALMIVNVSPLALSYSDTLQALKFAQQVNMCKLK